MARSVRIEMILDTLRAVKGAKDLAKATDGVADSFDDVATAGDRAARAADDAGDQMSDAARAASALDRQIEDLTGSLRKMAIAQTLTGDNFSKQIREQETQVRRLTRNRKLLPDAKQLLPNPADMVAAGAAAGGKLAFGLGSGLSKALPAVLGPAMAVVAPAVATTAGALISAGLLGGLTAAGIGAGIALSLRDPQIKAAAEDAADDIGDRLARAASPFRTVTLDALDDFEGSLARMEPQLSSIFSRSAGYAQPLLDGVTGLLERMVPAIDRAVARSGPVIDALADTLPELGDAVADAFDDISANGPEAGAALRGIVLGLGDMIRFGGSVIGFLSDLLGKMLRVALVATTVADALSWDGLPIVGKQIANNRDRLSELVHEMDAASESGGQLTVTTRTLFNAQAAAEGVAGRLTDAQKMLKDSIAAVTAETSVAKVRADALRSVYDGLYGATMRNADANQTYEKSWDDLSSAVGKNGRSLDIHTDKGRTNRTALIGLLKSNNDLYFANIEAGQSTDSARRKHEARTESVRKEAVRLKLNKEETQRLITTYGRIPPNKTTNLALAGIAAVADAMLDLAAIQLHLAKGTALSASLSRRLARAQYGMPDTKRAHGGVLPGHASHDRADNMVYAGTPGEWVIQRPTVRKVESRHGSGAMEYFNKYGELPGFASGGLLRLSRTQFARDMYYRVTAGMTKVPSMAQVIAAVPVMMGGNWPSSPSAQRGDSGVWHSIVRMIRATGPLSGSFGNSYRPGDPLWHGSGRAVDWMGYNQDALATFLSRRRPLELIHRTRNRDYAYTRGRNRGSFNNALMEAHRNHIHIAMANGGVIQEPVYGYGLRSGASYSFGERGPERVTPGAGGNVTVQLVNHGVIGSRMELDNWLASGVDRLKQAGRI